MMGMKTKALAVAALAAFATFAQQTAQPETYDIGEFCGDTPCAIR